MERFKMLCGSFYTQCLVGFCLLIILPYFHIGILYSKLWVPDKKPVSHDDCTCSCWDTIFKGSYESQMRVGYKHMYFNATKQTFMMWTITMAAVLGFYEVVKHLLRLHVEGNLRYSMLFLLLLDIHPHYYSWWGYLNYFNDDFYSQFVHQLFFTVTELISSVIVVRMCSSNNSITPHQLIGVLSINIVHILIGGLDQFFKQLLFMDGQTFQRMRNLGFIIPDLFHIIIPILAYKKSRSLTCCKLLTRKESICLTCLTIALFLLGKSILK
ncbi:Hypothetical predicted protein [Mytilus galloprovincialis]|nr:Hypothetical predicted protein [Mytilus galloprovincialis]